MIKSIIDWFLNLSNTDRISAVALIVAIYGAIVSTIVYNKEKLKIKLIYLNKNYLSRSINDYKSDNIGVQRFTYAEELYSLAIYVRISNNSRTNTTINSFILNKKYICDSSSSELSLYPISFKRESNDLVMEKFTHLKACKPLISLGPYQTIEGYIIFDKLIDIPSKIEITVNSVQSSKSFDLEININDCTQIVE